MQNFAVRQAEAAIRRTGRLDWAVSCHAVDQLPVFFCLSGYQKAAVHTDPKPLNLFRAAGLYLHIDAGHVTTVLIACGGDFTGFQFHHCLVSGDMLGQVGGLFICWGAFILLGAFVPIVQGFSISKVMPNDSRGHGLAAMGPTTVRPDLNLRRRGTARPEGLHSQFPVGTGRAG